MYSRRLVLLGCGSITSLAGCAGEPNGTDDGEERNQQSQRDHEEQGDEQDQEFETDEEVVYDDETNTEEIILNVAQLPDEFVHLEQELLVFSEFSSDDPERSALQEDGILRKHTNQFTQDTEPEDATFVSSTVFVCESVAAAESLELSRVDAFAADGDQQTSLDQEYAIPTTTIKNESDDEAFQAFVGRDQNMILELLISGEIDDYMTSGLYVDMVVQTENRN